MNNNVIEQWTVVIFLKFTIFVFFLIYSNISPSQDKNVRNCANVKLDSDNKKLSKQERLKLLNSTFIDSIDAYSRCISASQKQSAQQGSGAGGTAREAGSGQVESSSQENANSEASSESENQALIEQTLTPINQNTNQTQMSSSNKKLNKGAKNKLVAPKDNDLIVCQIIWDEINQETNEQTKTELTKQYRDYQCG